MSLPVVFPPPNPVDGPAFLWLQLAGIHLSEWILGVMGVFPFDLVPAGPKVPPGLSGTGRTGGPIARQSFGKRIKSWGFALVYVNKILALNLLSAVIVDLVQMLTLLCRDARSLWGLFLCCCCLLLATGNKTMRGLGRNFTVHQVRF